MSNINNITSAVGCNTTPIVPFSSGLDFKLLIMTLDPTIISGSNESEEWDQKYYRCIQYHLDHDTSDRYEAQGMEKMTLGLQIGISFTRREAQAHGRPHSREFIVVSAVYMQMEERSNYCTAQWWRARARWRRWAKLIMHYEEKQKAANNANAKCSTKNAWCPHSHVCYCKQWRCSFAIDC